MSAKVKLLAPITNKDSIVDTLKQLYCVEDIRVNTDRVIFRLKEVTGNHAFVFDGNQWNLDYEDFYREGIGKRDGRRFLDKFMPVYNKIQEERHAEELRQLVKAKEEEITAKAKAYNYRIIRKEEQGKVKLILVRPGKA